MGAERTMEAVVHETISLELRAVLADYDGFVTALGHEPATNELDFTFLMLTEGYGIDEALAVLALGIGEHGGQFIYTLVRGSHRYLSPAATPEDRLQFIQSALYQLDY